MEIEAAQDCIQALSKKTNVTVTEAINEVTNASCDLTKETINSNK